jgi:hypothetical protein
VTILARVRRGVTWVQMKFVGFRFGYRIVVNFQMRHESLAARPRHKPRVAQLDPSGPPNVRPLTSYTGTSHE